MNLFHLIAHGWRQRPARTLLSVASVAIAIAAVLGTSLSQSSVRQGVRKLNQAIDKFPAIDVVSVSGGRFNESDAPDLGGVPDIGAAVPVVARATLARVKGKRFRTVLVGLPIESDDAWKALSLTEGDACRKDGQAVLSDTVARSLGAAIGDRMTIITRHGPRSSTIVGLANAEAMGSFAPAASLVMPLEDVQAYFGIDGQVDRIRLLLSTADRREDVLSEVAKHLPDTLTVQSLSTPTESIDTTLRSTELALKLAGALSMAMAAFIILNTLRLNFSERRRDFAVVRVLGATRLQLMELMLLEGLVLGAVGSALGIPFGFLLGKGLEGALVSLLGIEPVAAEMPYHLLLVVLALGPIVAALAAMVPAVQARGITAAEAMGEMELKRSEHFPLWAAGLGLAAWTLAVGLVVLVVRQVLPPEVAIPAGLLMLTAFVAVIPAVVRPIVRGASWLLSPLLGTEGLLASEQLLARSTRTGLTVGVLVVALSSGLGLGSAIINNVDDVRGWYRRSLSGDVFLTNPAAADGMTAGTGETGIGQQIAAQPGVQRVVEIRFLSAKADGIPGLCIVRDFAPEVELPWVLAPEAETDLRVRLKKGEVALSSVMARKLGLRAGDSFKLEVQGRVFLLRIAALVNDYMIGGRVAYLDQAMAANLFPIGPPSFLIVQAVPGSSSDSLAAALEKRFEGEGLVVQSFTQLRRQLDGLIDGVVGALWGLLAVGFLVGGVAVSNTLTLNVHEQTRELGLLRIIGMTPGQTRRLVFCESLLLGLLGTLLGTLGGITTAIVIHLCNEPVLGRSIPLHLPGWLLVANAGGCLLIALAAAWRPGAWAARMNVLTAIAYE